MGRVIKRWVTKNTGNSVANYTEELVECERCGGAGIIEIDTPKELETGFEEIDCPECSGKGTYTRRY